MVTDSVVAFLQQIPPFQFLAADELRELSRSMSIEYFPKDTVVLSAGSKASEAMYIIQKGGVKLALPTADGSEVVIERDAQPFAVVRAAATVRRTISECIALAQAHEEQAGQTPTLDPDFAADVEEIVRNRKPWNPPSWD